MGGIQFPIAEAGTTDLFACIVIEIFAAAQDFASPARDVEVGNGLSLFIDDEFLFVGLERVSPLFQQTVVFLFF